MILRPAEVSDSKNICLLLIESITINCVADHKGNTDTIKSWCENKTPENIATWIATPENITLVAHQFDNESLDGVGLISKNGEILLCYVSPHSIGKGIGSALLNMLECEASNHGIKKIHLNSTQTAYSFYRKHGYTDGEEQSQLEDIRVSFPMEKPII